jgi:hypothetical protein
MPRSSVVRSHITVNQMRPDPKTTGAPTPLPATTPGAAGREDHERAAAIARADEKSAGKEAQAAATLSARVPLHRVFTILADNVRDYAVFLMDPDGIIACSGEGARLMKWWTKQQAEGSHLRLLYPDGGSDDGTAEAHLQVLRNSGNIQARAGACAATAPHFGAASR